jgi:glycosyltransferase involved in cell wall biosynthesis
MNDVSLLIPFYNHTEALPRVVGRLAASGLPCLVVNDGSDASALPVLSGLEKEHAWLRVMHRTRNGGKGAAVKDGLCRLADEGYPHALQLDADGQHDLADIPRFVAEARAHPDALILGCPVFDATVPKGRLIGRQISRWWVWIETLSLAIEDPLFGFRCYPLPGTADLIRRERMGSRMDFDPEIAVRLYWSGVAVLNLPTRVSYPPHGTSHFRMWRDNARISALHVRLLFGMLMRLPRLLRRRKAN